MAKVVLPNSEAKGLRVLLIDPDEKRGQRSQAFLDEDADLERSLIYVCSDLNEAKLLVKQHHIQLGFFPQKIGNTDFVSIQQELINAYSEIQLVPLLGVPSISQLRESKKIGNVADFGNEAALLDPKLLKELIFSYLRESERTQSPIKSALDYAKPLQKALTLSDPELFGLKSKSSTVLKQMLNWYEVDYGDVPSLFAAECVYLSSVSVEKYTALFTPDPHGVLSVLTATGSWHDGRSPSSLLGYLVTTANFLADRMSKNSTIAEIVAEVATRPKFIKHTAIRTLNEEVLTALLETVAHAGLKTG
jgi:hypothetical protein